MAGPADAVWLRLRRPFRYPRGGHACAWERYDADRAGCLLCGALHRCADGMAGCRCPLAQTDDGGHVCLITGLCIAEVRTCAAEYVDHVVFDAPREASDEGVHERVYSTVHWFLSSAGTAECRRQEREKYAQRARQGVWRALRQRKRDRPYELPCVCSVVAEVAAAEQLSASGHCRPRPGEPPPGLLEAVVQRSAASITACLLQIHRMGFRKVSQGGRLQSMVVGMLYMSRSGLRAGDLFHLPALPGIRDLLPSEAYLNSLGVSNKVICDTENEIKSCIREFSEPRVGNTAPGLNCRLNRAPEANKPHKPNKPSAASSGWSAPPAPSSSRARSATGPG
jgi:hypothetical protein